MTSNKTGQPREYVEIRWMNGRDLPEVTAIEYASFPSWWSEDDFRQVMRQRNCIGMVAVAGFDVVGYMVYELHKKRLHLINLAVHPDWRGCGVGTLLVDRLKSKLSADRFSRRKIMLEIRERNLPGQLFFRSQGFRAITVFSDFYVDSDEDAYLMEYRHTEPASMQLVG
jgi:ribosomal-protein-alanine N-acetyltransferase